MWYCPNCGKKNEGHFCTACGTPQATEVADTPASAKKPKETPGKNKGLIIAIIIAAAVIIAGALGICIFAFLNQQSNATEAETEATPTGIFYYAAPKTGDSISLYENPTVDAKELLQLKAGAAVELVRGADENYLYVYEQEHDLYGYVRIAEVKTSQAEALQTTEKIIGTYYVSGVKESLALKEAPEVNANELKNLSNGDAVSLLEMTNDEYWYVKDEAGKHGYVLKNYLTSDINAVDYNNTVFVKETAPASQKIIADYYVSGTKNYLAIRAQASSSNKTEIGKTYNGNKIGVIEKTNGTFWYIYDYSSGLYGYVKCAYLAKTAPTSQGDGYYYVSGTKNYLALRSEPKDGEQYEIGQLYNGDTVKVLEKTDNTYWYVCDAAETVYGYVKCAYLVD